MLCYTGCLIAMLQGFHDSLLTRNLLFSAFTWAVLCCSRVIQTYSKQARITQRLSYCNDDRFETLDRLITQMQKFCVALPTWLQNSKTLSVGMHRLLHMLIIEQQSHQPLGNIFMTTDHNHTASLAYLAHTPSH